MIIGKLARLNLYFVKVASQFTKSRDNKNLDNFFLLQQKKINNNKYSLAFGMHFFLQCAPVGIFLSLNEKHLNVII